MRLDITTSEWRSKEDCTAWQNPVAKLVMPEGEGINDPADRVNE